MPSPAEPVSRASDASARAGGEAGFTVLEAIVAVAILGLAMIPLLSLQVQTSQGAIAIQRAVDRRIAEDVGRSYLRLVDPASTPIGALPIGGGWTLSWTTEILAAERPAISGLTQPTRYAVGRYRLAGVLAHESGQTLDLQAVVAGVRETTASVSFMTDQMP